MLIGPMECADRTTLSFVQERCSICADVLVPLKRWRALRVIVADRVPQPFLTRHMVDGAV
jgi:hypothetical protein